MKVLLNANPIGKGKIWMERNYLLSKTHEIYLNHRKQGKRLKSRKKRRMNLISPKHPQN
jgi:hypothetical protein